MLSQSPQMPLESTKQAFQKHFGQEEASKTSQSAARLNGGCVPQVDRMPFHAMPGVASCLVLSEARNIDDLLQKLCSQSQILKCFFLWASVMPGAKASCSKTCPVQLASKFLSGKKFSIFLPKLPKQPFLLLLLF